MEEGNIPGNGNGISGNTAEEIIAGLRQQPASKAFCWLLCYEDRPMQGAPQGNSQPHLMIFTTKALGNAFIQGRRQYFAPEPLKLVRVDSSSTLKRLALAEAVDGRYTAPPCGLLLNFSYSTAQAEASLSPDEVQENEEEEIARALGLKTSKGSVETKTEEKTAEPTVEPTSCPLCHHKLYMPRRGGISIGFGDEALSAMFEKPDLAHTAYACRKCGTRICQTCATKYLCPRCKNNTFDRFDLAALPPPPPLTAAPKKPKPAKPKAAPAASAIKPAAPVPAEVKRPVVQAAQSAIPAMPDSAVPASKPAARLAPKWWMIAGGAALVLVFALLAIRHWEARTADEPAQVVAAPTKAEIPASLTIKRGPAQWTLTEVAFVKSIEIMGRETRTAPAKSQLLIAVFRCDTSRNPIPVLDSSGPQAPVTLHRPEGIPGLGITDESGASNPVQLIEVFDSGEAPESFLLLAIVPEEKRSYFLHFLDSPALPLDPALIPKRDDTPAPEPTRSAQQAGVSTQAPAPTEAALTLTPFEPIALPGMENFGTVVAFSPAATVAASGNCRGAVRLWDTRSLAVLKEFPLGLDECVMDIAFTRDGSRIAISLEKGSVFVADILTGDLVGQLFMPEVNNVVFSPQGDWLAAGSRGHGTGLWDMTKAPEGPWMDWTPVIIEGHPDNAFTCLGFDPKGEFLAIGESSGGLTIWDLKAGQAAHTIDATCEAPRSMSFSLAREYGGFLYFSGSHSQNVVNLTTGDFSVPRTFPFQVDQASAFIPRIEFTALVKTRPGASVIELWNNYHGELVHTLEGHKTPIFSIQFSDDGTLLLSGGYDFAYSSGEVFLWNTSEILP